MRHYILPIVGIILSFLLFGCGGAEDGDLTPPNFTIDSVVPSTTNDPVGPYLFFGTMDLDAEIVVEVNTSATISNLVFGGGAWSFELGNLADGANTVTLEISDPVGNSNLLFISIFLDQTGPVVTLNQYKSPTPEIIQTLAGTIAELDAGVEISTDGGATWPISLAATDIEGGVWSYDLNLLADGTYDVWIRGVDKLGNKPDETVDPDDPLFVKQTIVVDSAAPLFTVTQPTPVFLADPVNSGTVSLDGTVSTANFDLVLTTAPAAISFLDQQDPLGPDTWTADFDNLVSGATVATFSIQDLTPVEIAQANILIVRDLSGPLLIETVPEHGDKNVIAGDPIVMTFSESMANIVNDGNIFELQDEAGNTITFTTDPTPIDSRTFSFVPDIATPMQNGTRYTVVFKTEEPVTSVTDIYGNEFIRPTATWVFETQ